MARPPATPPMKMPKGPPLSGLLKPYRGSIILLVILTVIASALGLAVPKLVAEGIDTFTAGGRDFVPLVVALTVITVLTFVVGNLQVLVQTLGSERVARDLRTRIIGVIATQDYETVEKLTPAVLLTNLTSDVDAIKGFISQAVASLISSVFLIFATSALMLWLNWRLALVVLLVLPLIGVTFYVVLGRVRKLFALIQGQIDALNKVLNENIVGAALVRLLNAQGREFGKFLTVSAKTREISLMILRQFAGMIPIITFLTNAAGLTILVLGGHFVIEDSMTLGEFTAFQSYLTILIFPIIIIGFMSQAIGQAQASYFRISRVLESPPRAARGEKAAALTGAIEVKDLTLAYGPRKVLENVSFSIAPGSRTAIIGPTAAGKTQLMYVMTGLLPPTAGQVLYDGAPLSDYSAASLHGQIGFVFQDSALFNLSLRENIAFNAKVDEEKLRRAIETAELQDFIDTLPKGLDTIVSERGSSLSGGQKQRVMLARALAIDPKVLFLDDFTARVDAATEAKILENVRANYPDLTLISITQKIAPVEDYDQIILLMEGEVLASGPHKALVRSSPEYVQILRSQASTDHYEAA